MIDPAPDGTTLTVRVIPRASRTALAGTREGAVLIRLNAPPLEGAANAALVQFLAALLNLPNRAITIRSGEHTRLKRIHVAGIAPDAVRTRLGLT